MGSSPLQLAASAFQEANVGTLSSFTMTAFPYNHALDIINEAISEMNRAGVYTYTDLSQLLTYTPSVYTYNLDTVAAYPIEPRKIQYLRLESTTTSKGELVEYNFRDFQKRFMTGAMPTGKPLGWSKYGNTLYLSSIPDQDYKVTIYYFSSIPLITVGSNDTTSMGLPPVYEDILRKLIYALLLGVMGRPDFSTQYQLARQKVDEAVAINQTDYGMPTQMPKAF